MALKRLTVEEMIQISASWVTEGNPARTAIEKVPLLAALLPELGGAHGAIFALRVERDDPKVRAVSDREAALDAEHDERVRGLHGVLTALAAVSDGATELLGLREILLPEGLSHTNKTYRGEAGHGAMVEAQLDAQMKARLKAVNLYDKNLLDLTQGWLAVARELGQAEDERARLCPPPSPAADINAARLRWIRIVNALVANAEIAKVDAATDHLLFAPLRAAELVADRRRGKAPAPEAPAAPATPPAASPAAS